MLLPKTEEGGAKLDLSTLRTFRVLRPLKLVSGVPSKFFLSKRSNSLMRISSVGKTSDTCGFLWHWTDLHYLNLRIAEDVLVSILNRSQYLLSLLSHANRHFQNCHHHNYSWLVKLSWFFPQTIFTNLSLSVLFDSAGDGFWDDSWIFQLAHITLVSHWGNRPSKANSNSSNFTK